MHADVTLDRQHAAFDRRELIEIFGAEYAGTNPEIENKERQRKEYSMDLRSELWIGSVPFSDGVHGYFAALALASPSREGVRLGVRNSC